MSKDETMSAANQGDYLSKAVEWRRLGALALVAYVLGFLGFLQHFSGNFTNFKDWLDFLSKGAEAVAGKKPEKRRATAADAFRELIIETTRSLNQPTGLIIVDSLDEAMTQEGETIVDVLVKQAPDLPSWLRLVATTRPEDPILRRIRTLNPLELPAACPENLQDLEEYIKARLARQPFADSLGSAAAQTADKIISLAAGNFLYAQLVLMIWKKVI